MHIYHACRNLISFQKLLCLQISGPEVLDMVLATAVYQERRKELLLCPASPYFLNLPLSPPPPTHPCPTFLSILPFQTLLPPLEKLKIMVMLSSDLPSLGSQMQAAGKEEILHGLARAELHAYKSWLTPRFSDEDLILAFHSHSSPLLRIGLSVITHSERDLPSSRHPDPECCTSHPPAATPHRHPGLLADSEKQGHTCVLSLCLGEPQAIVATLQILKPPLLFIKDHRPILVFPGGC